jgi:hypothetical protein
MNIFEKVLENPKRLKRLRRICLFGLGLALAAEFAVVHLFGLGHGHFWFENLGVFGALFGFVSCALIIFVSKFLGHRWLMKNEDYYD